jgi:hypothetical protein
VSDGSDISGNVKGDNRRRHCRKLRQVVRHLINCLIGALDRNFHQLFDIAARAQIDKRFTQDFNRHFRSDISGLRAADAVGNDKKTAFVHLQIRIFILRTFFAQTFVGKRRRFDLKVVFRHLFSKVQSSKFKVQSR